MRIINRCIYVIGVVVVFETTSCIATPIVATYTEAVNTISSANPSESVTPPPLATATITETATITPTATKVPDVELAQLQVSGPFIIAELKNHLTIPVVFEDQQPAFRFDLYDPKLDRHFTGEEPIDRYNSGSTVPCVLYPGETAFFAGGDNTFTKWKYLNERSDYPSVVITYQSLGVPRPEWTENDMHYKIWDVKSNVDGMMLHFSFRHDPFQPHQSDYYNNTMGIFDKDNHLLGVAIGDIYETLKTGIADDYWLSFDNLPRGSNLKGWYFYGPEDAGPKVDHIAIMVEILKGVDGVCVKRVPSPTPH